MKKVFLILCVPLLIWGCAKQKPVDQTVIGIFTPFAYFPETVNQKVKEVKETNYLPMEREGKIVAGTPVSADVRDSIGWTGDFLAQFNESGFIVKISDLNEKGETTGDWVVENNPDFYINGKRIINDKTTTLLKIKKLEDGMYGFEVFDSETDTLQNKIGMKFKDRNKYDYIQLYNYKGEPEGKFTYTYDDSGYLTGFTYSLADTVRSGSNFIINEKGFFKTQESFNKSRNTSKTYNYEYEYDDTGNWIKSIAYNNDKPIIVSLREYVYY